MNSERSNFNTHFRYHLLSDLFHDATVIHTLPPTSLLPYNVQPMISTRVFRKVAAGILGFAVFCSFLHVTRISKVLQQNLTTSTADGPNTAAAGVETAVSPYYVTRTSVLKQQTAQEKNGGDDEDDDDADDEEETAIHDVDDHASPPAPSGTGTGGSVSEQNIAARTRTNKEDTSISHDSSTSISHSSEFCPRSLASLGAPSSSSTLIWRRLHDKILSSSYDFPAEFHNSTSYRNWIGQLFQFYNAPKLRRTIAHPAPPQSIVSIFQLALEVQEHNRNNDNDEQKRTVRILVLGGSVTAGHDCQSGAAIGIQAHLRRTRAFKDCAWPARLEHLLNSVIFDGEEIFEVSNEAMGGMSSDWGAFSLKYRLFSDKERTPDVVISAFSANDAKTGGALQDLIEAAKDLQPCNDDGPLIIMVDDFYGNMPFQAARHTALTYMSSMWGNLMAVSGSSVLRYKVLAEYLNNTVSHPLTNSEFGVHLGVGVHTGMAWIMLFNFVNAFVDVCNDYEIGILHHKEKTYVPPLLSKWNGTENGTIPPVEVQPQTDLIGDPDLLQSILGGEPPFKNFGKIKSGGTATLVADEYQESISRRKHLCKHQDKISQCAYSWFVSMNEGGINTKHKIQDVMKDVLTDDYIFYPNGSWWADGVSRDHRPPPISWAAQKENATFTMKIENVTSDTNYVMILSMKSYDVPWLDSRLMITPRVVRANATLQDEMKSLQRNEDPSYFIDGYHKDRTR